jgi:hypothetical protein
MPLGVVKDMTKEDALVLLGQLSSDPDKLRRFVANQTAVLAESKLSIATTEVQQLLNIIAGLQSNVNDGSLTTAKDLQENFANMTKTLRQSLLDVLSQIEGGFKHVQNMYLIAFYLGIVLVTTSILFGIIVRDNILTIAFGGLGTTDIIVYFVYRPAELLQASRANLAKLVMAFMGWLDDAHNWNTVFRKAFAKAEEGGSIHELVEETSKISEEKIAHVKETIKAIEDSGDTKGH